MRPQRTGGGVQGQEKLKFQPAALTVAMPRDQSQSSKFHTHTKGAHFWAENRLFLSAVRGNVGLLTQIVYRVSICFDSSSSLPQYFHSTFQVTEREWVILD